MSFFSFPLEIRDNIISHLDSSRDLAALSRSCRALHSLCNMPMRKKFHLIRVYPDNHGVEQAFQLLMDILKRPSLGQYVREIRYYGRPGPHGDWGGDEENMRELSGLEMDLLQSYVQKAGFTGLGEKVVLNLLRQKNAGQRRGQRSYFSDGWLDPAPSFSGIFIAQALAAILISVTPNLVSLAIMQPSRTFVSGDKWFYPLEKFLHLANAHPENNPYLQNLRKVYLMVDEAGELDDGRYYIHIEFIGCFRMFDQLPSIESVGIDGFRDDDQDEAIMDQGMSNLTKIHINHSSVRSQCVARAVLACRTLKELQYSVGGRAEFEVGIFCEPTFVKAILGHKDTLESLDIDAGRESHHICENNYNGLEDELQTMIEDSEWLDRDDYEGGPEFVFLKSFWGNSGSLKDFVSLRRLEMGIGLLLYFANGVGESPGEETKPMLVDCLPDNLEYLCIRGYQRGEIERYDAQVEGLIAAFDSGATKLKEIRGIEEMIPHADHVGDPDKDELWSLESAGYGFP